MSMITRTAALTIIFLMGVTPVVLFSSAGFPPPDNLTSVFDEMEREGILEITLETDVSYLLDHPKKEVYKPAVLKYEVPGKGEVERSVKVRLRGKFRRRVCSFPPLKLKFSEDELRKSGLDPVFKSLKLVTHCLEDRFPGNENVLKEYLIYKLYGLHTDDAFRVQLVKITYRDNEGKGSTTKRYGFIIEDPDELAYRLGGSECEEGCLNPDTSRIVDKNVSVQNMFQFMIGNEDWDIMMMRNLKLIELNESSKGLLVPYDFDFSGLVNASYALPSGDDGLRSVRDRIYLGPPVNDEVMRWTVKMFLSRQEAVLQYVRDFRLLSRQGRKDVRNYLLTFYDFLEKMDVRQVENIYGEIRGEKLPYVDEGSSDTSSDR